MNNAILVFFGGGIGALLRYWMSGGVQRIAGFTFPYGTLSVNVLGCFVIGTLMIGLGERFLVYPSLRIFLTIGVLGGFTTFSSFSYETISLLRDGEIYFGLFNVFISVASCLGATYLGSVVGKWI